MIAGGFGTAILGFIILSSSTRQRITSDASAISPIYFPLYLSSRISNPPIPLCIIFASISNPFIDTIAQQERFSSALLDLIPLLSVRFYLPNLDEIVFITCLISFAAASSVRYFNTIQYKQHIIIHS